MDTQFITAQSAARARLWKVAANLFAISNRYRVVLTRIGGGCYFADVGLVRS